MKKIVLLLLLFFNILPHLQHGQLVLSGVTQVAAQDSSVTTQTLPEVPEFQDESMGGTEDGGGGGGTPPGGGGNPCPLQYGIPEITTTDDDDSIYTTTCIDVYDCNQDYGLQCTTQGTAKTPCDALKSWVNHHTNGSGIYYDTQKTKNYNNATQICTDGGFSCANLGPRYWMSTGGQTYYWNSEFLSGSWVQYKNCSVNCLAISFDYTISVTPPNGTERDYSGKTNWCGFADLEALKDILPCTSAAYYYANYLPYDTMHISGCNANQPVHSSDFPSLYGHFGVTATSVTVSDACGLINAMYGGGKGVLNYSANPDHMSLIYGVHRDASGNVTIDKFDTSNPSVWNNPNIPFTGNYAVNSGNDFLVH
jgi:hypothetical protein